MSEDLVVCYLFYFCIYCMFWFIYMYMIWFISWNVYIFWLIFDMIYTTQQICKEINRNLWNAAIVCTIRIHKASVQVCQKKT